MKRKRWHASSAPATLFAALMLHCARCEYEWMPRVVNPRVCPRCKNPYTPPQKGKGGRPRTRTWDR